MGKFFILLVRWLGEIVFSTYYLVHLGRGTYFCYVNLKFDIVSIIIFSILCFFYLLQTIWRLGNEENEKTKKQYQFLKWSIHILFNAFFFYEYFHHPNVSFLIFSISLYWMMEWGIHIWIHRKD